MAVTGRNIGEGGDYGGNVTPTLLNQVNMNTQSGDSYAFSVSGHTVTVQGSFVCSSLATGTVSFSIPLPVASALSSTRVGGSGYNPTQGNCAISPNITTDEMDFSYTAVSTGNSRFRYSFSYDIR